MFSLVSMLHNILQCNKLDRLSMEKKLAESNFCEQGVMHSQVEHRTVPKLYLSGLT
jgi:hypothetical protein